jgi:hypothetical protein
MIENLLNMIKKVWQQAKRRTIKRVADILIIELKRNTVYNTYFDIKPNSYE